MRTRWPDRLQRAFEFALGTNWSYSNSGYILARKSSRAVPEKSFAQFSMERFVYAAQAEKHTLAR